MKGKGLLRLLPVVLVLVLVFAVVAPVAMAGEDGKARVWVQFAPGARGQVEKALGAANAEFHYTFDGLDAFVVSVPQAALNGLSHNPNIVLIEEDVLRFPIPIEKSQAAPAAASTLAGQVVPYGTSGTSISAQC